MKDLLMKRVLFFVYNSSHSYIISTTRYYLFLFVQYTGI